ncbi:hypothetical protein ACLB2K_051728 [Fragaria x ananassa]
MEKVTNCEVLYYSFPKTKTKTKTKQDDHGRFRAKRRRRTDDHRLLLRLRFRRRRSGSVASAGVEYQISEEQKQLQERHERAKQELLRKRRASALAVPTNDNAVRARLRRLGEPMTLFGEREMERHDRLRMILANLDPAQQESLVKSHEDDEAANADDSDFEQEIEYPFFTEATRPKALREARVHIAHYSMPRAALRLQRARRREEDPDEDMDAEINWALGQRRG